MHTYPEPSVEDFVTFTPAGLQARHDGWTAERQRTFILTLADTGCISKACAAVGIQSSSAYRLRRRADARGFAAAWDQALVHASQRLVTIAMERALVGNVRETYVDGVLVRTERVPADRLLTFLITKLDKSRFGCFSGLMPVAIEDPRAVAAAELPRLLEDFRDVDEPIDAELRFPPPLVDAPDYNADLDRM